MNGAQKKAFVARMKAGRAAAAKKKGSTQKARAKSTKPRRGRAGTPARAFAKAGKRRNPDELAAAEAMYEAFHGRPPHRVIEYDQDFEYRAELAELGRLIELRYEADEETDQPLRDFGQAQVACTPDGKSLYIIGGRQELDLRKLDIDSDKDYVELGPLTYIKYHTYKGFHDFEPTDYYHQFGEEDGIMPVLAYDAVNKALFIIGGNYKCKPEGIVN